MDSTYLTIGQMAKLNHISTQTLRLYDHRGLLKPKYTDSDNGYRYYHIDQCAQLDIIHTMKICGMTLEQIQTQLQTASIEDLQRLLLVQDESLRKQIEYLTINRKSIARINSNLQCLKSLPPTGQIFFEYIPERRIDITHTEIDFFTQGYSGYERMLRQLKDRMIQHDLPMSYFFNAGTLIEKENFAAEKYIAQTVFIFVDEDYPQLDTLRTVPAGMVIAICADDPEEELNYAKQLYQEIQHLGYEVIGDYLCEVISQFPTLHAQQKLIYKIQVPVQKKDKKTAK